MSEEQQQYWALSTQRGQLQELNEGKGTRGYEEASPHFLKHHTAAETAGSVKGK